MQHPWASETQPWAPCSETQPRSQGAMSSSVPTGSAQASQAEGKKKTKIVEGLVTYGKHTSKIGAYSWPEKKELVGCSSILQSISD